jgi:hypothetical protein
VLLPAPLLWLPTLTPLQIGDKEEMKALPKPLPAGTLIVKFPDVIDIQCPQKEGNISIKLWCPDHSNRSKSLLLSSSSFPLKSITIGSHDKQILLKGRCTATLSCRIIGEAANEVESQNVMQSRARYEASNKSKFALVKELLLNDGGLLFTQFLNTLDIRFLCFVLLGRTALFHARVCSELDSLSVTIVRVLGTGTNMEKILEKLIEQVAPF